MFVVCYRTFGSWDMVEEEEEELLCFTSIFVSFSSYFCSILKLIHFATSTRWTTLNVATKQVKKQRITSLFLHQYLLVLFLYQYLLQHLLQHLLQYLLTLIFIWRRKCRLCCEGTRWENYWKREENGKERARGSSCSERRV